MKIYPFSFFSDVVTDKDPIIFSPERLFNRIKSPYTADMATIIKVRQATKEQRPKKEINELKKGLPAVSISGVFEDGHLAKNLVAPSGLMQIDIDHVESINELAEKLKSDPLVLMCFVSPSATGLKAVVPYDGPDHLQAFLYLEKYFKDTYGVEIDQKCKDICRLCFLSYDPNCYYNPVAKSFAVPSEPFPEEKPTPKASPVNNYRVANQGSVGADVEKVIDQICLHRIDITSDYDQWLKIGFAFGAEFGEAGRNYYHAISQYHPEYDPSDCNKQYDECLKDRGVKKSSIRAFFGVAKDYGLDIRPAHLPEKSAVKRGKTANEAHEGMMQAAKKLMYEFDIETVIDEKSAPETIAEPIEPVLNIDDVPVLSDDLTRFYERLYVAAKEVVKNQSGLISTIQRKLQVGYNMATRLMEGLENAGVVGPASGANARKVLITDINQITKEGLIHANSKPEPTPRTEPTKEEEPEPDPDSIEALMKPIVDSEDTHGDFSEYGFYVENSSYGVYNMKQGHWHPHEISNFCMEYLYHFDDGSKNTKRLVKIQRNTGEISIFEMSDEEAKLDKFKTIIRGKACSFKGTANQYESVFIALSNLERKAKAISMIGYNAEFDFYAFSDAIFYQKEVHKINEVGIIHVNDHTFYLPAYNRFNIDNPNYINERRCRYMPGEFDFETWSRLIYQAYGVNGAIGICFVIQCLFRDVIFKNLNFFPFLFLFGPPGVGKSTYIDLLLRLWGEKEPGVSLKSNFKAIARSASQRKNAMLFLKEYDNNISPDLENAFKSFYDGQGYSTAQTSNDNRTNTWLVESGIIIDGNSLPTKSNAFFDRNIILNFEENKFSAESTAAYKSLNAASTAGFSAVMVEILSHRETYKERIKKAFDFTYSELKGFECTFDDQTNNGGDFYYKGVNISKLPERTINHVCFIISAYNALKDVLKFPFDPKDVYDKVLTEAIEKTDMMAEINDVSLFWDSLNYAFNVEPHKVMEGKQYARDLWDKVLYIKINDLYLVYCDYCKRSNINFVDKQTLVRLLTSESYTPFWPSEQKGRGKAYTKAGFGSCYRFRWTENEHGQKFILGKEVKL